jgi:ribosome-associated toxin RatA of RatAB toxin-antitoxin module
VAANEIARLGFNLQFGLMSQIVAKILHHLFRVHLKTFIDGFFNCLFPETPAKKIEMTFFSK